jgi:hypothetical protein
LKKEMEVRSAEKNIVCLLLGAVVVQFRERRKFAHLQNDLKITKASKRTAKTRLSQA